MNEVILHDAATRRWLHFREPRRVIEAHRLDEVLPRLRLVEGWVRERGYYAAGFIAYEAAPAFDSALRVRDAHGFPLLWFGLYPSVEETDPPIVPSGLSTPLGPWTPTIDWPAYEAAIEQIKVHIARGDTYQVNYTFRLRAPFAGDPRDLFAELVRAQRADYGAYVDAGRFAICSASPELFFRLDGDRLAARPMKGTAPRGRFLAEDDAQAEWLRHSEKNRAENVMIVDMVRNDMGRIAEIGSVEVPRLFTVERYPTIWQMTSTVLSRTKASLAEVMAALFPCASITGAPKPRTMQIIARLETAPRRIYTGCIGYIAPERQAQFNVAIRTVLVDREAGQAEYGVGGGIVWDSVARDEYEECRIKARVLTERRPEFSLLETMRWTPGEGYFLLDDHLRRLRESAIYFGFPLDSGQVQSRLAEFGATLPPAPHRVRLLLGPDGEVRCEAARLDESTPHRPVRLRMAPTPIDPRSLFLYHKTTHRQLYEAARAACPDCDDVLLWNERGEVTETTIGNVVVRWHGEWITPPVACGLLPGTFRAWLLDQGKAREQVVTIEMLKQAEQVCVVNSVRGWQAAVVEAAGE